MSKGFSRIQVKDTVVAAGTCEVSGERYIVCVSSEAYYQWQAGMLIQMAFPQLTADEREFFKTGITPKEWEKIFSE